MNLNEILSPFDCSETRDCHAIKDFIYLQGCNSDKYDSYYNNKTLQDLTIYVCACCIHGYMVKLRSIYLEACIIIVP